VRNTGNQAKKEGGTTNEDQDERESRFNQLGNLVIEFQQGKTPRLGNHTYPRFFNARRSLPEGRLQQLAPRRSYNAQFGK
jgi:hypothetical protein